jgi:hypothetical protein
VRGAAWWRLHRWPRPSEFSGGSTYVEWLTHRAKWGVRELTDEVGGMKAELRSDTVVLGGDGEL